MTTPAIMLALLASPLLFVTLLRPVSPVAFTKLRQAGCLGITFVFCFTGAGHFVKTAPMSEMLPAWVPGRIPLVYFTGIVEIAAAVMVLLPRMRRVIGWLLIGVLIAFLPVNVYAAANQIGMGGHQWGPVYLLIRVPLQVILMGWVWWFAVRPETTQPVRFACRTQLPLASSEIAEQILDLSKWPEFTGYGPLPGIQSAKFEHQTPEIIGTRIRVTNTDGSSHVEEIVQWQPNRRLQLRMHEFSPPLSRLATHFTEIWEFERDGDAARGDTTEVVRSFELHARSAITRPAVWLISLLLRRSISLHLQELSVP